MNDSISNRHSTWCSFVIGNNGGDRCAGNRFEDSEEQMIFDWYYDNVKPWLRLPISGLILFILMAIGYFLAGTIGQVVGLIIFYLLFLLRVRTTP